MVLLFVYGMFTQSCQSKVFDLSHGVSQYAWFPCEESQHDSWSSHYWLKVREGHVMFWTGFNIVTVYSCACDFVVVCFWIMFIAKF